MKAIRVNEAGEADVLVLEEVVTPSPGAGEVVVKVKAAGVNPVEVYIRRGTPPYNRANYPYTPGTDGAGEVAAVGEGVTSCSVGDRVFITSSLSGTYAEFALCKAGTVYPLPEGVSFGQGAALGIPYGTAHRALFGRAGARAGQKVFVHGATGGVGVASVQLAMAAGLKVYGSAGGPGGEDFLHSLGVKYTCDHHQPDYMSDALGMTCGQGFDIILEMLTNVNLPKDPDVLAPGGCIVVIGNRGSVEVNPRDWMAKDITIYGMTLMNVDAAGLKAIYQAIGDQLRSGALSPHVGKEFPLAEAGHAQDALGQGGARGKVVLIP
jgi:NADPH2:quinone reductase